MTNNNELFIEHIINKSQSGEVVEKLILQNLSCDDFLLEGVQCLELVFENISFNRVDFKDCDLSYCSFENCKFNECKFDSLTTTMSNFADCIFNNVLFYKCNLIEGFFKCSVFHESNIQESFFSRVSLIDFKILGSSLTLVSFGECKSEKVVFKDTNTHQMLLVKFNFTTLELINTVLDNLIALECDAQNIDLSNFHLAKCQFSYGNLANTNFKNSNLDMVSFKSCNLNGCDFSSASLNYALVVDATCHNTNFCDVKMHFGNFQGSDLFNCKFDRSDFYMTQFQKANFINCSFRNCLSLLLCNFSYSTLTGTDFSGTKFERTTFHLVKDDNVSYDGKLGIIGDDKDLLEADLWMTKFYE